MTAPLSESCPICGKSLLLPSLDGSRPAECPEHGPPWEKDAWAALRETNWYKERAAIIERVREGHFDTPSVEEMEAAYQRALKFRSGPYYCPNCSCVDCRIARGEESE